MGHGLWPDLRECMDDPHMDLILVTAAASLEALNEFRGGLIGGRSDFRKRGCGPKEDLFLVIVETLDESGNGGLCVRAEQCE